MIKKILINKELIQKMKTYGLSTKKISNIFKCCKRTIWNWLNKEYGENKKRGRIRKIDEETSNKILEFINKKVMITQYDIQNYLEKINIKVHQSTISRFLKLNNKLTKRYSEKRDITEWVNNFKTIDKSNLMSLDESAFMLNECPRYGYSLKNSRAIVSEPGQKGKRYTLLLCVSNNETYVKHILFDGSLKTDRFCTFISEIDKNGIIILDNAACHRAKKVKDSINKNLKLHFYHHINQK